MQCIQHQTVFSNIGELIANMLKTSRDFPPGACKTVWTTAQMVMNKILRCNGANTYKLHYARKDKIIRKMKRNIPLRLPCQEKFKGGAIDGEVIAAYMTGGVAAAREVVAAPVVMLEEA